MDTWTNRPIMGDCCRGMIACHLQEMGGEFLKGFGVQHLRDSCTSWEVVYPIIYKVLYIPGGAGFRPSTVFGGNQDFFASKMLKRGGARAQSTPCWGWNCIIVCVIVWCCAIVQFCQHKNNRRWCPCFFLYIAFIFIIPFNLFVCQLPFYVARV